MDNFISATALKTKSPLATSPPSALRTVQTIAARFGVQNKISAKQIAQHGSLYAKFIERHFESENIVRHFPVQTHIKKRLFQATLDALIILPNHTTAFIISDSERSAKPVIELANRHTLTLFMSRQILQNTIETRHVDAYLHLPLQGAIARIEFV